MGKKINLSQNKKDFLKKNFDKIKKPELSGEQLRYYILIENGKRRAKNSVRYEGRYLSGEILNIIQKVADRKGISLNRYLDQNKEDVGMLIESGFTQIFKRVDAVIDLVAASKKRTIEIVRDPEGIIIHKVRKLDAIAELSEFQNYVKGNSDIVELLIKVKIFKTGKIRIALPWKRKQRGEDLDIGEDNEPDVPFYEDYEGEALTDFLDDYDDIEYIESDPSTKK
jgi:SNF2 family DNA or RNA helicase